MKLYRFRYSPYARKVQVLLDMLGHKATIVEVPYSDRTEIATVTGGYIYVPVLVDDAGKVLYDSRVICETLLATEAGKRLVPPPLEGPMWAYHDFCDGPLEDVLFRIATPYLHDAWTNPSDRALFALVKERKFGAGCVEAWERDREALIARARHLLAPTLATLAQQPFVFGEKPTLADAALYGLCMMLEEAKPGVLANLAPPLVDFRKRLEAAVA